MNKKEAAKIILKELEQVQLFTGKYDADNGDDAFMYGVLTVMNYIAYLVSIETQDAFHDSFVSNMIESEEKKGEK